MNRNDIERFLERGDTLGFNKPTDDIADLGWILIRKQKPHDRYLRLLAEGEEPIFRAAQGEIRLRPFQVQVLELSKKAHENDEYESNEDYRINQIYRFSTRDEIESFLSKYGCELESIKWPIEIGAP
jgi:hypothetical protein